MLFAKDVSDRKGHTLAQDIKMHFAISNAMFDAGIAVWGYKRQFDNSRPITVINFEFNNRPIVAWAGPNQGTKVILGQNWRPYQAVNFVTPPFGEHISGHSTFSASGSEVLKLFTGSDNFPNSKVVPAGFSIVEPGVVPARDITLSWPTFSAAANEAGISRLYGGIHFRLGDQEGRKLGRKIGAQAFNLAMAYANGSAGD